MRKEAEAQGGSNLLRVTHPLAQVKLRASPASSPLFRSLQATPSPSCLLPKLHILHPQLNALLLHHMAATIPQSGVTSSTPCKDRELGGCCVLFNLKTEVNCWGQTKNTRAVPAAPSAEPSTGHWLPWGGLTGRDVFPLHWSLTLRSRKSFKGHRALVV